VVEGQATDQMVAPSAQASSVVPGLGRISEIGEIAQAFQSAIQEYHL
jgi:hypothetical protein